MNKTVNINLAGIFFHIDEDAYLKLQGYLETIKRSFTDSQGRDEIIADIEARIAELFSEKIKDERQVITTKEVDEVIEVMGQPEDYRLDDEIFEDEPKNSYQQTKASKQLFRDTSNSYVGGVSSGLGHYIGFDPTWVRLAWILFTIFSSGAFILIYIAFWIFVPEAKTTADELAMRGKHINISTIEKKIKDGFEDVADTVKNVDYQKYSNKVKSSSATFFEALGDVLQFILKIFSKFIGIIFIIIAGLTLIGTFIGLFAVSTFGFIDAPWVDYLQVGNFPDAPIWLVSLLCFLFIGIPFFFLFILGLKILINNLKSIGTPAKLSLLAVWILSFIGLTILGIRHATQEAYSSEVITDNQVILPITHNDTLTIRMVGNNRYAKSLYQRNDYKIKRDANDNKIIVIQDIELYLKASSTDTVASITIEKKAEGSTYEDAKTRAEELNYSYEIKNKTLLLDGYAITEYANKYRDQEVKIILTLPEGITLLADQNTSGYNNSWKYDDDLILEGKEEKHIKLSNGKLICADCPKSNKWEYNEWDDADTDTNDNDGLNIDIKSDDENFKLKIDENGLEINNDPVNIKIDEDGIEFKTEK